MFSGIIHHFGKVVFFENNDNSNSCHGHNLCSLTLSVDQCIFTNLVLGASICVDGVCLTVCSISKKKSLISFNLCSETINNTTLKFLKIDQLVHIERSLAMQNENGGHNVSGHVDGMCRLVDIIYAKNSDYYFKFSVPTNFKDFLFDASYISLSGVSLTLKQCDRSSGEFCVNLVSYTYLNTNFKDKKIGSFSNFELDHTTKVLVTTIKSIICNDKLTNL